MYKQTSDYVFTGEPPGKKRQLFGVSAVTLLLLVASLAGYVFIGYFLSREDFILFASVYLVLFAAYIYFLNQDSWHRQNINEHLSGKEHSPETTAILLNRKSGLKLLLNAAILFRLLFLFSIPSLSEDYLRFIWDGALWIKGVNPYSVLPSMHLLSITKQDPYLLNLYAGMNSPGYFSVYPPVCQFTFALAVKLFPADMRGSVIVLHLICIAAEAGTIYLLQKILSHFNLPKKNVLLYALNPLIIIELGGNIHFEAVMIFFIVLAAYMFIQYEKRSDRMLQEFKHSRKTGYREFVFSAIAFALAIGTKLIPLIFLPFLIWRLRWKRSIFYFSIIALSLFILFLPFLNPSLISQFSSSVNLYFQKFEFNAGIFYLIREAGFHWKGHDVIQTAGPWLASITFFCILLLTATEKNPSWNKFFLSMQWALTIYLMLSTTVHPWYITTLVMLSVITGYRYPVIWSLLIAFTYAAYQTTPYQEQLWLVALEYGAVITVLLIEIYNWRKMQSV
ncbi:MAG: DUF2029 domain-containing protein [Chitinophagales bacterium]|nr:DUF2029 domain-containing protein [Chitinophagales bacterium]